MSSWFPPGGKTKALLSEPSWGCRGLQALGHGVCGLKHCLVSLQEWKSSGPTRASVSELHSEFPLCRGPVWGWLRLHCNLEHQDHTPQYQIHPGRKSGRQEQEFEDWAHLESSSPHHSAVHCQAVKSSAPQPLTVDRPGSEYTGEPSWPRWYYMIRYTNLCIPQSLQPFYPGPHFKHYVGWE